MVAPSAGGDASKDGTVTRDSGLCAEVSNVKPKKKKGGHGGFDWSTAKFDHFLLKIAYVGTGYHGLAAQEGGLATVESRLFEALMKTCLVRDRQSCRYSRCGRTDKGVHASGNYIALDMRVKRAKGGDDSPYDYASMLNNVLPDDIRILAVEKVADDFDARFKCRFRVYRYFFPLAGEDLARMNEAGAHFVGEHDFRNFCKMDVENVSHFRRKMMSVGVTACHGIGEVRVVGTAFLWHQVRCMVAVLLLIGQGLEDPSVVRDLLNVDLFPQKPLYDLADESGLVLYDCGFEDVACAPASPSLVEVKRKEFEGGEGCHVGACKWARPVTEEQLGQRGAREQSTFSAQCAQARRKLAVLQCLAEASEATASPAGRGHTRKYVLLCDRAAAPSLDEKQATLEAKRARKGSSHVEQDLGAVDD